MKKFFLVILIGGAVALATWTLLKRGGSGTGAAVAQGASSDATPKDAQVTLQPGGGSITVTRKPGMTQEEKLRQPEAPAPLPQEVATTHVMAADGTIKPGKSEPNTAGVRVTQTPALRFKARTEAMEQMLRTRAQQQASGVQ